MPTASRAGDSAHQEAGRNPLLAAGAPAGTGPRASWRAPAGLAIIVATAIGLGLRALVLFRPGFLASGTVEYDDGVYFGAAIRLLQGVLPYRGYAYVQPPGIVIVALPFALVAKAVSASAGLAAARVATACASAACIPLAGRLVRHKGVLVTLVTCGFLAVYPADVLTARTLMLEPWMNLCCLLAANAAFSGGRLAGPRRLVWAGVALGFAVTIKFWAAVPAVVLLCGLLAGRGRWRRARGYLAALVVGFAVPVIGLAAAAPTAFVRGTLVDQVTRMGAATSMTARLAYLTGLIPVIGRHGQINVAAGAASALAVGANGTMVINGISRVPQVVAAFGCVILAAAYFRRPRSRSPLEWFALATAAVSVTAISLYSAFFYHYPAFPAPWLAIALGTAAGAAAGAARRAAGQLTARMRARTGGDVSEAPAGARARPRGAWAGRLAAGGVAVAVLAVAVLEGSQLAGLTAPYSPRAADRIIPAGACVVTDQVSFSIAADRLPPPGSGCPDVLDSLATTLRLSGGVSVPGGAGNNPRVTAGWEAILGKARYVWLTAGYRARIPWTRGLRLWFAAHFRAVRTFHGYGGSTIYERIT